MMQFDNQDITVETPFGPTRVRISGEAMRLLREHGSGRQDAAALLAENEEIVTHLATIKREADEVDDGGAVGISAIDVDVR